MVVSNTKRQYNLDVRREPPALQRIVRQIVRTITDFALADFQAVNEAHANNAQDLFASVQIHKIIDRQQPLPIGINR